MREFRHEIRTHHAVGWLTEPRELHPETHTWVEANADSFDRILTYDEKMLQQGEPFRWMPSIGVTIPKECWGMTPKSKGIGMFLSPKYATEGHRLRREIATKFPQISVFTGVHGDEKVARMSEHRFWLVIENSFIPNYYTEALLDPISLGCLPIYYRPPEAQGGLHPLEDYMDTAGIVIAGSLDRLYEVISIACSSAGEKLYEERMPEMMYNLEHLPELEIPEDWMVQHALGDYLQ